jgi:hypothetical protein
LNIQSLQITDVVLFSISSSHLLSLVAVSIPGFLQPSIGPHGVDETAVLAILHAVSEDQLVDTSLGFGVDSQRLGQVSVVGVAGGARGVGEIEVLQGGILTNSLEEVLLEVIEGVNSTSVQVLNGSRDGNQFSQVLVKFSVVVNNRASEVQDSQFRTESKIVEQVGDTISTLVGSEAQEFEFLSSHKSISNRLGTNVILTGFVNVQFSDIWVIDDVENFKHGIGGVSSVSEICSGDSDLAELRIFRFSQLVETLLQVSDSLVWNGGGSKTLRLDVKDLQIAESRKCGTQVVVSRLELVAWGNVEGESGDQ